jgi:hypothetical protein
LKSFGNLISSLWSRFLDAQSIIRAPIDIARLLRRAGSFAWAWLRAGGSEREAGSARVEVREVVRTVRVREPGDVNLSTLLSLVMLAGLGLLALAR